MPDIYARHHRTEYDAEASELRASRQPQPWTDIDYPTRDRIAAQRADVAELEASLADIECELGWASLTGDGPACDVLVPMAETATRDLAEAKARLQAMEDQ
jgi:hypothetical protein